MNRKIIYGLLLTGIVVAYSLVVKELLQPQANFTLAVAPDSAVVTLNTGKEVPVGNSYLKPGEYTLMIKQDGFADQTKDFTITEGKSTKVIAVLTPNSLKGTEFLEKHTDQQALSDTLGSEQFDVGAADTAKTYPIISLLPHSNEGYTINYGQSKKFPHSPLRQALYITIDNDSYKTRALNWIRYQGFNPDSYEIVFNALDARD